MDTNNLIGTVMLSAFILAGIGVFISPESFYAKIQGTGKNKHHGYEIRPSSVLIQRLSGLIFAIIAFLMLINL